MVGTTPRWNNLPLLFPRIGGALIGCTRQQVAWSSCQPPDPMGFCDRYSFVYCLAGYMGGGRRRRSFSLTASEEVDRARIWWTWGRTLADGPQSLGLVACGGLVDRLKRHPCMRRCSLRSRYSGSFPLSPMLPRWRLRTMLDDDSAWHRILHG